MVAPSGIFLFDDPWQRSRSAVTLGRLPRLQSAAPIRIHLAPDLHDVRGPVHAGSFLRERRIAFDCTRSEFPRIFVHEVAHFIWLRLGNPKRLSYQALLHAELAANARGELGWSAEWRKWALRQVDLKGNTRRWREYCCESFCDTAAWRYSGLKSHPEFTLAVNLRSRRARWLEQTLGRGPLSI
jgi:hypothetical protein